MRSSLVLLVFGATLLSTTKAVSGTATKASPNINRHLRSHTSGANEAADEERLWGLFGGRSKKFEEMLINNPKELNKYSTNTIHSNLKRTKHTKDLLIYLNRRARNTGKARRDT
ncbi:hypothetical protein F441_07347 [Phytophthora nicotianae CJ01A1]|uniref:RxLR effector protein n=5 Tax=Phytophthora nicotianae TaxID=4792 RepID=V9FBX4_PHYNI|nr:hypothetical protein F443_07340 [Phytophthora nicotianae P1569]ETL95111.1 hypothetical protein L917_07039 [Phytophthora nicotianae]ETO77392.1 hypothetical protein F444_07403 [Phytophthora nicotianae P1976]ETP18409.1 hypothetical protein F441_07347 [Phytophthora nicotianae CJ01A1]ETP46333.1 hypothetical protein F442_07397 [Phytophthora nicotianae P10297]